MIRRLAGSRLLRLFSGAVIDQALLSAANFAVGLLLIRHAADADYGYYVLVQTSIGLLVLLQAAWIGGPVSVQAPKQDAAEKRRMVGAAYCGQRRWARRVLLGGIATTPLVGLLAPGGFGGIGLQVFAAGVLASWAALDRDYLRTVLLIYTRPQTMIAVDAVYVSLLIAGVALALLSPVAVTALAVLALTAASAGGSWLARRAIARDPGWQLEEDRALWQRLRPLGIWSMAGAVIYWSSSQGYNYLLAAMLDIETVAAVAATRLLLMPVNLLTTGVKNLLVPVIGGWLRQTSLRSIYRRLLAFSAGMLAVAGFYCVLLWLLRGWITGTLLQKDIAQLDVLLLWWAGIFLLCLVRDVWQSLLLVQERFRALAKVAAFTAAVSLPAIVAGMHFWGAPGALLGLAAGEVLNTVWVFVLLRKELRTPQ